MQRDSPPRGHVDQSSPASSNIVEPRNGFVLRNGSEFRNVLEMNLLKFWKAVLKTSHYPTVIETVQ